MPHHFHYNASIRFILLNCMLKQYTYLCNFFQPVIGVTLLDELTI